MVALAGSRDPVEVITERARALILSAMEAGVAGPPFDPFALATYIKIAVVPREDITDARTVPAGPDKVRIEFNPNRPRARVRYSIAHELAHTLFPDCIQRIRHRAVRAEMRHHDAQLETLCNIGAAELLMPIGSFPSLRDESLSIDHLMDLRHTYDVSSEALLLRVVRVTNQPCMMFCASRNEAGELAGRYQVDYAVSSRSWSERLVSGSVMPVGSAAEQCTAIGFTAKGREEEIDQLGQVQIECVGIPPYPGRRYPRVVGIISPAKVQRSEIARITYLKGDATEPRGTAFRLIAHIVNDKAPTWGAGFALFVRKKWPGVQEDFKRWAAEHKQQFALGSVHISTVSESMRICHMIAQHGYGPSPRPRIRYVALRLCLARVADEALRVGATVHVPRIGTGQAGGSWEIVSELIEEALCKRGTSVTVYDLPANRAAVPA